MIFKNRPVLIRWILILASFAIVSGILWNTYIFFQEFKKDERIKMEIWTAAQKSFIAGQDLELAGIVITGENTNPRIIKYIEGGIEAINIDEEKVNNSSFIQKKLTLN